MEHLDSILRDYAFTRDNTHGFTARQLDLLNCLLRYKIIDLHLDGDVPDSDTLDIFADSTIKHAREKLLKSIR